MKHPSAPEYDVAIIGAGLAGLAISLRLKKQGFRVLVIERGATYGGKLAELSWEGYRWDKGPSLFTLPDQVDDLFTLFGENPRDYFQYEQLSKTCHYYFPDKTHFNWPADIQERQKVIAENFSASEANKVEALLEKSAATYDSIGELFIDHAKFGVKNLLDSRLIRRYPQLLSRKLTGTLNAWNRRQLSSDKLVTLFNRYGTYNGSNPFEMSGLYSMIPHLEMNNGTFFPVEGMRSIVSSLYELCLRQGITFRFNQKDTTIHPVKAGGYRLQSGDGLYRADKVVSAIDCVTFYQSVLKDEQLARKYRRQERSSSGLIFYWAVEKQFPQLAVHNIFFSANYRAEFEAIFKTKQLPEQPTIYLHVSSVANASDAPPNGQNWFIMINIPAGVKVEEAAKEQMKNYIIDTLSRQLETDISPYIRYENNWDAEGIKADTGSFMGALYGAASNKKMAALTRHGNRSTSYKNLYFVGGTVHPGGGIPLVLKSAKIVSEIIANES